MLFDMYFSPNVFIYALFLVVTDCILHLVNKSYIKTGYRTKSACKCQLAVEVESKSPNINLLGDFSGHFRCRIKDFFLCQTTK